MISESEATEIAVSIRDSLVEEAVLCLPSGDRHRCQGGVHGIDCPAHWRALSTAYPGAALIHSHPSGDAPSAEDFEVANEMCLAELRVVLPTGTQWVIREDGDITWMYMSDYIRKEYRRACCLIMAQLPKGQAKKRVRRLVNERWSSILLDRFQNMELRTVESSQ